jgi:intein/homing endonuclease
MKTSLKNATISIEKIGFDLAGKISIKLEDGRLIIVPLKYFPELQKLPVEKRKKYTIVDERTILFSYSDNVYHLEDFMGLEQKWRQR